uniref:Putative cell division control protein 42-like protein n=1 Tax=Pinctada fucata TaxID=50426 RepID=A0A194AP76_PINFU
MAARYEPLENSSLKCVVIGDTGSGKSALAHRIAAQEFKSESDPTLFDNFAATITVDGIPYHLSIFDTTGKHDMARLRALSYVKSDVVIVCFSMINLETFNNVKKFWVAELRHHLPRAPFLLVGTHTDVRYNTPDIQLTTDSFVSPGRGSDSALEIGAFTYLECSSLTGDGIDELCKEIVVAVSVKPTEISKKSTSCCAVS